jgi:hypothetical protein
MYILLFSLLYRFICFLNYRISFAILCLPSYIFSSFSPSPLAFLLHFSYPPVFLPIFSTQLFPQNFSRHFSSAKLLHFCDLFSFYLDFLFPFELSSLFLYCFVCFSLHTNLPSFFLYISISSVFSALN